MSALDTMKSALQCSKTEAAKLRIRVRQLEEKLVEVAAIGEREMDTVRQGADVLVAENARLVSALAAATRAHAGNIRAEHAAEINRRLKARGFEPGELQAALRGGRGDHLAPFTTQEIELGLLDAFSNEGGATVWCGDGSSCAVQIVEHQIRLALSRRDAEDAPRGAK